MTPEELTRALRVIVIVERRLAEPASVADIVSRCLDGGARAVQVRNKGDGAAELLHAARELRALTRERGALLFVNDRLDVALAAGADGIHVGPDDVPVAALRRAAPPGFLIGRSADEPDVARRAIDDGADYIGCGAVYPTGTKADAGDVIGLDGLRRVVASIRAPVVGIGGFTAARAVEAAATGAAGVAVVSAVMGADAPEEVVSRIVGAFGA